MNYNATAGDFIRAERMKKQDKATAQAFIIGESILVIAFIIGFLINY